MSRPDPVIEYMKSKNIPITREAYRELAWLGKPLTTFDPEELAEEEEALAQALGSDSIEED